MAINPDLPKLSEAELNSPDIDQDGETDVQYYPVPEKIDSGDAYVDKVWSAAAKEINNASA